MVSQDLIYSILPRQMGQVEHKKRMVEKIVRRSSLKAVEEDQSSTSDIVVDKKERRGDRRSKDRREIDPDNQSSRADRKPKGDTDNDDSHTLDVFA